MIYMLLYDKTYLFLGHVGPPIPNNMIKMMDVPEMNYFAENQQGEVCCYLICKILTLIVSLFVILVKQFLFKNQNL